MKPLPPPLFHRFFRWYCHPKLRNGIEGDLMEVYNEQLRLFGKSRADLKFIIDVLLLFRPGIIRPTEGYKKLNSYGMYKSYFKMGWRSLLKEKGYSIINIGGLAMGMSIALLIGLWIHDELQFDKYHKNHDRIAQVYKRITLTNESIVGTYLPSVLADELKTKYGNHFTHVVKASQFSDHILSTGENKLSMRGGFVDADAPGMFSLNMLRGSLSGLNDMNSILLSRSAADALFGKDDPMDKLLKIGNRMDVKVAGVFEDLPHNTTLHSLKFFAPWELLVSHEQWMRHQTFSNNFMDIYVAIADNTTFDAVGEQVRDAIKKNIQEDKGYLNVNPEVILHPMKDWHLRSEFKNGVNAGGMIQTVWLFGIVGAFVLLLACINFMNLSTARSGKRAKEVCIRKAIGSKRAQLMSQFFSESFLVVALAFVVALIVLVVLLPSFNQLAGKEMKMPWTNAFFWLSDLGFILVTGLLAGSYPALYLSSFNPVSVLKGALRAGRVASIPRKVLVVVQFTVSVTLIIGTIMVYRQIQFAKNRPIGFTPEGLLVVEMVTGDFHGKHDVLSSELRNTGVVTGMAESSSPPTDARNRNGGFRWRGMDPTMSAEMGTFTVTPEYGKVVGWEFVDGRDFSRDLASDSAGFVINEAAAKLMGFENPVGEIVSWEASYRSKYRNFNVIGVIRDVLMKSPYATAQPAVFFLGIDKRWMSIRIDPGTSASEALPKIESVFRKLTPSAPFDYKFADQEYALKFAAEERVGKLASVFAVLAIFISCLGLFGLASFVAEQRTKEIGIRKVVGASVFSLWKMLSGDFIVLVVISCSIAIPVAAYFLSEWLSQYDYRTEIVWWVFAVTAAGALAITLMTVSYQAIKAAMMKPVRSLRSE